VSSNSKTAVLAERVEALTQQFREDRDEQKNWRNEMRRDLATMRAEIVGRMQRHEDQDQENFKAIDDRMAKADAADAAVAAVAKYRRWQWGILAAAGTSLAYSVFRAVETYLLQAPIFPRP